MPYIADRICQYCGNSFLPKQNHPKYKYCSSKCKDTYHKQRSEYKAARCAYMKQHREANLDLYKERNLEYYKKNKYKFYANNARRRALIKQATPLWANRDKILAIYKEAELLGYHVDHVIPLRGKLVCGLHVEDNLQILSPTLNLIKGNNYSVHEEW